MVCDGLCAGFTFVKPMRAPQQKQSMVQVPNYGGSLCVSTNEPGGASKRPKGAFSNRGRTSIPSLPPPFLLFLPSHFRTAQGLGGERLLFGGEARREFDIELDLQVPLLPRVLIGIPPRGPPSRTRAS